MCSRLHELERHLFAEIVGRHLRLVTLQRMTAAFDVFRSERAGNQETLSAIRCER